MIFRNTDTYIINHRFKMSEASFAIPATIIGKFNILMTGNKGVGKTSYVRNLLGYPWQDNYTPCEISTHILPTNKGNIRFDIYETESPQVITTADAIIFLTNSSDNFCYDHTKFTIPKITCITMAEISKAPDENSLYICVVVSTSTFKPLLRPHRARSKGRVIGRCVAQEHVASEVAVG